MKHTVKTVEDHSNPPHWRIFCEFPQQGGGVGVHCYALLKVQLRWRAAEYGIDPADSRTLLDVCLHEHHMVGHDHTSPDFLYNCDRPTARRALLNRVQTAKDRVEVVDPDGLLEQIHSSHRPDPEDHAARVAYINHVRQHGHAQPPILSRPEGS